MMGIIFIVMMVMGLIGTILILFLNKDELDFKKVEQNNIQKLLGLIGSILVVYTIYYAFSDKYLLKYGVIIGCEHMFATIVGDVSQLSKAVSTRTEMKYLESFKWFIFLCAISITLMSSISTFKDKD